MSEPEVLPVVASESVPTVETAVTPPGPIVARAGRYYRNARYVMTLGLLIMGGYFLYDGYKGWPDLNAKIDEVARRINDAPTGSDQWIELDRLRTKLGAPKSETSIGLQKVLGFALPLAAVAYVIYFLRKSRGEIRLDGDTLTAPGHPPVPLTAIRSVDESLWKKKGIATVKYDVDGKKGAIVLDDFVYQQTPIDAIYDQVSKARGFPVEPLP